MSDLVVTGPENSRGKQADVEEEDKRNDSAASASSPETSRQGTPVEEDWNANLKKAWHPNSDENGSRHDAPVEDEEPPVFMQPSLVTGAKLKNYQLEGLQWMVSLDQNGISGILGMWSVKPPKLYTNFLCSRRDGIGKGAVHLLFSLPV